MEKKYCFVLFLLIMAIFVVGCSQNGTNIKKEENTMKNRIAVIETDKGTIKLEVYEKDAPITAKNFIELAQSGFYNGLTFHRVVAGFVAQGGDPSGDGTGGSDNPIQLEIKCTDGKTILGKTADNSCTPVLTHVKGALAMARTMDPNSATSQFYITFSDVHQLDRNYTVFGKVIEGMDVVEKIEVGDKMNKVTIANG